MQNLKLEIGGDEVKIIDRGKHWKRRLLKGAVHMLGYSDLLS